MNYDVFKVSDVVDNEIVTSHATQPRPISTGLERSLSIANRLEKRLKSQRFELCAR